MIKQMKIISINDRTIVTLLTWRRNAGNGGWQVLQEVIWEFGGMWRYFEGPNNVLVLDLGLK